MHTVREFIERAFAHVGRPLAWQGKAAQEVGKCAKTGRVLVRVDPRYYRPAEVEQLLGNPAKAKRQLGWTPTVKFPELVRLMIEADLKNEGLDPAKIMRPV
jgi:GDPmannose 4,6-dehydratase